MVTLVDYVLNGNGTIEDINIPKSISKGYIATNPSCVYYNDGLYINCRLVDYIKLLRADGYTVNTGMNQQYTNSVFNSINIVHTKDGDFKSLNEPSGTYTTYNGLEDVRLVVWNDKCYAYGTRWDKIDSKAVICIYELNDTFDCIREYVISYPLLSNHEKNWGAVCDKPFTFVYTINPTQILTIDPENSNLTITEICSDIKTDINYRGNSALVRYDEDTYIQLVHESHYDNISNDKYDLKYKYAFIFYDNNFNIKKITKQFNFRQDLCEFSCGIEIVDDTVYIAFSEIDSTAELITISKDKLNEYLDGLDDEPIVVDKNWVYYMVVTNIKHRNIKKAVLYGNYYLTLDDSDRERTFTCAILVLGYYVKRGIMLEDMHNNIIKLQGVYPESKEFIYIEALLHKALGNNMEAKECKMRGDLLNSTSVNPFFLQIINPLYI